LNASASRLPIGLWALALGTTGFAAGFFGPIALNPDANQGPLVGIFITGPGGALGGLILGAIFRLLPVSRLRSFQALVASCAVLALGTLFFCLPEPAVRGYVIDAEVQACASPLKSADAALDRWEKAVADATWYTPPSDWQETAIHNLARAEGVVLTLRVARRATISEHRKPWNAGRLTASPWQSVEESAHYYASDAGNSCDSYTSRGRTLYTPFTDSTSSPTEPATLWPPTDPTSFLSLMELGPVPPEYRRLLER